jgi:hypothetical protein
MLLYCEKPPQNTATFANFGNKAINNDFVDSAVIWWHYARNLLTCNSSNSSPVSIISV